MSRKKILLQLHQSPGDTVVATAAVRDLHRAFPDQFEVFVLTSGMELWENNPGVKHGAYLSGQDRSEVQEIELKNEAIEFSNHRPGHYIGSFHQSLGKALGVEIPVTEFKGDIYLSELERRNKLDLGSYWVVVAGGKTDFTTKWWPTHYYQDVIDTLRGQIYFVQCGNSRDVHPRLDGAYNMVGRTNLRDLIQIIHHSDGVLCPVTLAMHLAAAVPMRDEQRHYVTYPIPDSPRLRFGPPLRPCVVIAGGREAPHWEAYPGHRFLHTVGAMKCCAHGGCYRARVEPSDYSQPEPSGTLCLSPEITVDGPFAGCMRQIEPFPVLEAIYSYYTGGALKR